MLPSSVILCHLSPKNFRVNWFMNLSVHFFQKCICLGGLTRQLIWEDACFALNTTRVQASGTPWECQDTAGKLGCYGVFFFLPNSVFLAEKVSLELSNPGEDKRKQQRSLGSGIVANVGLKSMPSMGIVPSILYARVMVLFSIVLII